MDYQEKSHLCVLTKDSAPQLDFQIWLLYSRQWAINQIFTKEQESISQKISNGNFKTEIIEIITQ